MRRTALRVLRLTALVYLGGLLVLLFAENYIVYPGWTRGALPRIPLPAGIEEVSIDSTDGVRLHGWYKPHSQPRAIVLFCHGNGDQVPQLEHDLDRFHACGASILAFDYRGYGQSTGRPSEAGILADARAARSWLAKRAGVPESEIVLVGRSLGGGVAVDLAARDGCRALVLQSTFTSLPDVAAQRMWWLPVHWLMRNRLDSASKIAAYPGPVLQSHGRPDEIVPLHLGRKLHELIPGPKRFLEYPELHHNQWLPDEYNLELARFLDDPRSVAQSMAQPAAQSTSRAK